MSHDFAVFEGATRSAARFVYEYVPRLVLISVVWIIASLPVVTLGVATLGAYTAVLSLHEKNHIDRAVVRERIITNGRDATLLAPIPLVFVIVAGLYATGTGVELGVLASILALVAVYIAAYVGLVLIPTFVLLAHGVDAWTALGHARRWLGEHPTLALSAGFVTVVVLAVSLLLTILFPLLFGGVACSYHVIVVKESELLDAPGGDDTERIDEAVA